MRRLLEALAATVLLLTLAGAYLTRPGPAFPLPFQEITARLSADGETLCFTAQRGARAEGRLCARRDSYAGPRGFTDVFLSHGNATLCLTSDANGASYQPALSPDGKTVAFCSEASNLAAGDRNASVDVFLWTRSEVSRLAGPLDLPGRSAAYDPAVTNDGLVACTRAGRDGTRELFLGHRPADLGSRQGPVYGAPSFAPDGQSLAVSLFAPQLEGGGTRLQANIVKLSLSHQPEGWIVMNREPVGRGVCFSPSLADGACAYAATGAHGFYQVYVNGTPITDADEDSFEPSLSADGRYVAFTSYQQDHRSQVYLHDRQTGKTRLASHRPDGQPGGGPSYSPSLAADGSRLAFVTQAPDLEAAPVPPGQIYLWENDRLQRVPTP